VERGYGGVEYLPRDIAGFRGDDLNLLLHIYLVKPRQARNRRSMGEGEAYAGGIIT
jgi:hypothetical protein